MSYWTNLTGIIRVDGIETARTAPISLGATTNFHSEEDMWTAAEKDGTPMGSEGSLQWEWVSYGKTSSICKGHYAIHGDLRDYDSIEPIVKWLKDKIKILDQSGYSVRQLSMVVDTYQKSYAISIDRDTKFGKDTELVVIEINNAVKVLYGEKNE